MKIRESVLGKKFISNTNDEYLVINQNSSVDVTIQFFDKKKTIVNKLQADAVRKGMVKNPNKPLIFNIGYIGQGLYIPKYYKKIYYTWKIMIERCYSEKFQLKYPTYIGCTVDEKWHNFQTFAEWYENNIVKDWELDKDILIIDNKIYGPNTCCFVPDELNQLFKNHNNRDLPTGVYIHGNKYSAQISATNNINIQKHLGTFDTIDEAYSVYIDAKKSYILSILNKYDLQLSKNIKDSIIKNLKNYGTRTKTN